MHHPPSNTRNPERRPPRPRPGRRSTPVPAYARARLSISHRRRDGAATLPPVDKVDGLATSSVTEPTADRARHRWCRLTHDVDAVVANPESGKAVACGSDLESRGHPRVAPPEAVASSVCPHRCTPLNLEPLLQRRKGDARRAAQSTRSDLLRAPAAAALPTATAMARSDEGGEARPVRQHITPGGYADDGAASLKLRRWSPSTSRICSSQRNLEDQPERLHRATCSFVSKLPC